jgi:mannose-6-phosphate isomerase-like protein (cupin superfamily)
MDDPGEIERFHDRCSDLMRELLAGLAGAPDQPRPFPEIEDAIGWPRRRIASVLGGVSRLRLLEFGGRRPYHFLEPREAASRRWELWMDSAQAGAVRSVDRWENALGLEIGGGENDFVIVEWTDSGDSEWEWIAPLHVHHADDEAWYVLEGSLRFRVRDDVFEAGAGRAVLVPKGTPHAYGNARKGERARYLLVMTPRIRALVRALHEPGAGDYAAIFRAHESELLI